METNFEWDPIENALNQQKHHVSFEEAQHAFADTKRIIAKDIKHSLTETRYYCFGNVNGGIMTVRFTYRKNGSSEFFVGKLPTF